MPYILKIAFQFGVKVISHEMIRCSRLQSFTIHTSAPLVIEWFFNGVSLAIETRYQNMAVMAVCRKQWKRHVLVATVNVFPVAIWTNGNLLVIVRGQFDELVTQSCKMPFT